jgi:hypothetical protein
MRSARLLRNVVARASRIYKRTEAIGGRIHGALRKVEEPPFTVEVRDGPCEIRRYAARTIAETTVSGDWTVAGNEGFRRLAGYIFGKNQGRRSIAMTAPVAQAPPARVDDGGSGARISMTAPVVQRADRSGTSWTIGFTMPAGETLATLPVPDDARVVLRELPPARVAVVRFSGRWTVANMKKHEEALGRWARARKLIAAGEPEINRYDPPFKPWFLRRNEVWLPLEDDAAPAASRSEQREIRRDAT